MAAEGVCRTWFPFGGVIGDSFCVMELRDSGLPGAEREFGARVYGPHAVEAAEALVAQIKAWDAHGREIPGDAFAYWPAGIAVPSSEAPVCLFRKNLPDGLGRSSAGFYSAVTVPNAETMFRRGSGGGTNATIFMARSSASSSAATA
jgi:hypothetical protein